MPKYSFGANDFWEGARTAGKNAYTFGVTGGSSGLWYYLQNKSLHADPYSQAIVLLMLGMSYVGLRHMDNQLSHANIQTSYYDGQRLKAAARSMATKLAVVGFITGSAVAKSADMVYKTLGPSPALAKIPEMLMNTSWKAAALVVLAGCASRIAGRLYCDKYNMTQKTLG